MDWHDVESPDRPPVYQPVWIYSETPDHTGLVRLAMLLPRALGADPFWGWPPSRPTDDVIEFRYVLAWADLEYPACPLRVPAQWVAP